MGRDAWYVRYAWIVFVIVAVSGLVPGLQLLVAPLSGEAFLEAFGYPVPAVIHSSEAGTAFLAFLLQWTGIMVVGADLLTVLIASTAFRRGERWSWYALWYWPFVFGAHFFMYTSSFRFMQLVWVALTVGALIAVFPKVFGARARALETEAAPAAEA